MDKKKNYRESGFELLRIVCMLFVVMQHFWGHALYPELQSSNDTMSPVTSFMTLGLLYVAVNCFVLISGYFRIKTDFYRFFSFTFLCIFYNCLSLSFLRLAGGGTIGRTLILSIFTDCFKNWWFISFYVFLMLIAPFLNKAIESFSRERLLQSVIFVGIADQVLGYFMNMDNGYSLIHFIFLYVLGAYISRDSNYLDKLTRTQSFLIYVMCTLIWGIIAFATSGNNIYFMTNISYNNPLIVIGSLSFFNIFRNIHFKSRVINTIASFSIAAYLIQDGIGRELYPWFNTVFNHNSVIMNIAVMIVCSLAWFIGCSIIDFVRQYLWKVIENWIKPIPIIRQISTREGW